MSTTLQQTINWAQTFVQYTPLTAGVGNELALSLANEVVSTITSAPFTWPWNRAEYTSLVLERGVQDYVVPVSNFGFLEKATLITAGGEYSYEIKDVYNSYMLGVSVSDFAEPKAVSVLNGCNGGAGSSFGSGGYSGGFTANGTNYGFATSIDSAVVSISCVSNEYINLAQGDYLYVAYENITTLQSGQAITISGSAGWGGLLNTTGFIGRITDAAGAVSSSNTYLQLEGAPNGYPPMIVTQGASNAVGSGSSSLVVSLTQAIQEGDFTFIVVYIDFDATYGAPTFTSASGQPCTIVSSNISGLQYAAFLDLGYFSNSASDTITITTPHTASISASAIVTRYGAFGVSGNFKNFKAGASTNTSFTFGAAPSFILGVGVGAGSGTIGPSDGKTLIQGNGLTCFTVSSVSSAPPQAVTAAFSGNTSQFWSGVVAFGATTAWLNVNGGPTDPSMICPLFPATAPSENFSASGSICARNTQSPFSLTLGSVMNGSGSLTPIAEGQLMVVTYWCSAIGGYISLASISDPNNNTWSQLVAPYQYVDSTGEYNTVQVFYALANEEIAAASVATYALALSVPNPSSLTFGFEASATTYNNVGGPVGSPTTAYVADGVTTLPISITTSQTAVILALFGGAPIESITGSFSLGQAIENGGPNTLGASGAGFWFNPTTYVLSAPPGTYPATATLNTNFGLYGCVGIMSAFSIT